MSTGVPRPYIPQQLSNKQCLTLCIHSICATQHLITSRYMLNINKDVHKWARCCVQCQKSKIHCHTTASLGKFTTPDARFVNIHIEIIGPLPPSQGC